MEANDGKKGKGKISNRTLILILVGVILIIILGAIYFYYLKLTPDNDRESYEDELILFLSFDKPSYNLTIGELYINGTITLRNIGESDLYLNVSEFQHNMSFKIIRPDNSNREIKLGKYILTNESDDFNETNILISGEQIDILFDLYELDGRYHESRFHESGEYNIRVLYYGYESNVMEIILL